MSENELWIEACYENFQQSLLDGNYEQAVACIGDMHDVDSKIAGAMRVQLKDTNINNFAIKSPYVK